MEATDVLEHYGIKGMRWGVRRSREQIDADSEDAAKAKEVKQKIVKNRGSIGPLTNQELKTLNERMQLEQNFQNLMAKERQAKADRSKLKQGKKAVDVVLDTTKTLTKTYNTYTEVDKILQPDKYLKKEAQKQAKKEAFKEELKK